MSTNLPTDIDATYPDDGDASRKIHQQHHDAIHGYTNTHDTTPGAHDHGQMAGLADDDHPQYLLATGKAADADKLDGLDSTAFLQFAQGAWLSYTPTVSGTGWAPGNGTLAGRYRQLDDKTLQVYIRFTTGSTSTIGAGQLAFSLPSGMTNNDAYVYLPGAFIQNGGQTLPAWGSTAGNTLSMAVLSGGSIVALTSGISGGVPVGSTVCVSGIVEMG